jgi:hypothetical protein
VYAETHTPTTNANGLLTVEIGAGTMLTDSFGKINWANGPYFIKTEIDPNGGTNYSITGTTQLLSVPYALHARTADSIVGAKSFSGNYNDLTNKPITISNIVGDTFYLSNGGYILSAKPVDTNSQPRIVTNPVTNITSNGARFSASIINDSLLFASGISVSTNPNPSPLKNDIGRINLSSDNVLEESLRPNTTYYVRAFAITESNTYLYGNQVSFTTKSVGQQGPGGGVVFYDKGDTIGGWRYLEAAPTDQSIGIQWGCSDSSSIATSQNIGEGASNTLKIVSSCNDLNFAAKLCSDLVLGGKSDWFLPSSTELYLLIDTRPNDFQIGSYYWSSSTVYNNIVFSLGRTNAGPSGGNNSKAEQLKVRAIRAY